MSLRVSLGVILSELLLNVYALYSKWLSANLSHILIQGTEKAICVPIKLCLHLKDYRLLEIMYSMATYFHSLINWTFLAEVPCLMPFFWKEAEVLNMK